MPPRRLLFLPGDVVCYFPAFVPRVGFPWDAEVISRRRRMVRSYSAFGDFVACALAPPSSPSATTTAHSEA